MTFTQRGISLSTTMSSCHGFLSILSVAFLGDTRGTSSILQVDRKDAPLDALMTSCNAEIHILINNWVLNLFPSVIPS